MQEVLELAAAEGDGGNYTQHSSGRQPNMPRTADDFRAAGYIWQNGHGGRDPRPGGWVRIESSKISHGGPEMAGTNHNFMLIGPLQVATALSVQNLLNRPIARAQAVKESKEETPKRGCTQRSNSRGNIRISGRGREI